jgi:hypothetical protein
MKKLFALAMMICLSGCLERIGQIDQNLKPYGAHWIKEGMTRESRRVDYMQCGGGSDLREGYEVKSGQSNKEFFDGFNVHTHKLLNCMKSKGYVYLDQCNGRCLYP